MARNKLTPADLVISLFGVRPLASELECSPTTVLRWRNSPSLAGKIPVDWHLPLLALAKRRGEKLSAEELLNGR